jgi:hypothetical protein
MKTCAMCKKDYDENIALSQYAEAGEWLAGEIWKDSGELCQICLENRARLVMMYHHQYNS